MEPLVEQMPACRASVAYPLPVVGRGEGDAQFGLHPVVVEEDAEVAGHAAVGLGFDGVLEPAGLFGVLFAVLTDLLGGRLGGERGGLPTSTSNCDPPCGVSGVPGVLIVAE